MKIALFPPILKCGNIQPEHPRKKADKLLKRLDTMDGGALPTQQAFEVIERALAGLPQRGPGRVMAEAPSAEAPSAEDVWDAVVEIATTNLTYARRIELAILELQHAQRQL